MDGRAELKASQPCRTDKKPVLDINPKPSLRTHLFWFTRDRAKYSHHHLLLWLFLFCFLGFFLSHRTSPVSVPTLTPFSLLTSVALGPVAPSPAGPGCSLPSPPSSPWVSDRRGWQSGPQHHFLSRALPPAGGSWQVVYLSQGYWQRSYRWNSICLGTDVCLRQTSSPCCVSPSRSLFFLLLLPRPSSVLRSPSSHVAEDELKPGQAERGTTQRSTRSLSAAGGHSPDWCSCPSLDTG